MIFDFVNKIFMAKKKDAGANPAGLGVQIALLLLNAQKATVAADVFAFQIKAFNKTWAAEGWNGFFEIQNGIVIFNS